MTRSICPACGRKYEGLEKYCTKCGVALAPAPNVCSEMKTAMCRNRVFAEDDLYCCYCGSLTTYAKGKMAKYENERTGGGHQDGEG